MKTRTLAQQKQKTQDAVNRFVRLRDCYLTTGGLEFGVCCTCGAKVEFKSSQAGHFMQGLHNSTRYLLENIHLQCYSCNIGRNANLYQYTKFMYKTYGKGFVDSLERLDGKEKKFTKDGLRAKELEYIERSKRIEKEGCLSQEDLEEYQRNITKRTLF